MNEQFDVGESIVVRENYKVQGIESLLLIKNKKEAQDAFLEWIKSYNDKELARLWSTSISMIKKIRYSLGITKDKWSNITLNEIRKWPLSIAAPGRCKRLSVETEEQPATGYKVLLSGSFNTKDLSARLLSVQGMLELSEKSTWIIKVEMVEILTE